MDWMFGFLLCVAASCSFTLASPSPSEKFSSALLGEKECLDGPAYWCQNFTTSRQCNANRHCIRTVWEHMTLPPDNGDICEKCKLMVTQAREELKSNETQENLKLVLEGSCMILIPIKPLARECAKMVDKFIPELIEALSSQMDPQSVCSIAGLCNSHRIDKLLAAYKLQASANKPQLDCDNCRAVAKIADGNLRSASRDQVLNTMLELCGHTGSFSDGCSATVIVNFNKIYDHLIDRFHPDGVCHMAGICSTLFHTHDKAVQPKPAPELKGDIPCELCEQLVQHLRDILVANTTEKEFEQVLLGICKQTGEFTKECVDIVESYYETIYQILVEELNGNLICQEIGICPKTYAVHPLNPLLPVELASRLEAIAGGLHRVPLETSGITVHSGSHSLQVQNAQLPLDSLILTPAITGYGDKELCQMCEYFLHFMQEEMTDPMNEQALQRVANRACDDLPSKVSPICHTFVDTYTSAFIAIAAQDIDPSQVCPLLKVCPGLPADTVSCEPCKATALSLIDNVASNTTEANIRHKLQHLCLPLKYEDSRICSRIVMTHHNDLSDMIVAEFTGEEMCYYMKYCTPSESLAETGAGDTETNSIPKTMLDEEKDKNICVMCEFVMKTLEDKLTNNKTEEEIRHIVEHVCLAMPHSVRDQCKTFVDQYTDLIVTLLAQSVAPKEICTMIHLCSAAGGNSVNIDYVRKSLSKCVVCESLMGALQGVLADRDVERDINQQLEVACSHLPHSMRNECQDIVYQMAPQIEAILAELPLGSAVCRRLQLCGHSETVDLVSSSRCLEGPKYWCQTTMHAATCKNIDYCQRNVWLADKPNKKNFNRAKKIIY